jgi:hypothetical protein
MEPLQHSYISCNIRTWTILRGTVLLAFSIYFSSSSNRACVTNSLCLSFYVNLKTIGTSCWRNFCLELKHELFWKARALNAWVLRPCSGENCEVSKALDLIHALGKKCKASKTFVTLTICIRVHPFILCF